MNPMLLLFAVTMAVPTAALADTAPVRRPWQEPITGDPFFPLGWYDWEDASVGLPPGQPSLENGRKILDEFAEMGANAIVFVNSWGAPEAVEEQAYLDHASTLAIKVIFTVGGHQGFLEGDDARIDLQRRWITAIKDHEALLGYQCYDEPEFRLAKSGADAQEKNRRFVQALIDQHDAIRTWDANTNHLVHLVFNMVPPFDKRDWRRVDRHNVAPQPGGSTAGRRQELLGGRIPLAQPDLRGDTLHGLCVAHQRSLGRVSLDLPREP